MKFNIISKLCLLVLAVLPLSMAAQTNTKLSIEDFTIRAGQTKTMSIDVNNPDMEVTLVQFDMQLPAGLSIAIEDDEFVTDIARTTYKKHSLNTNVLDDGSIRFLLSSTSNKTLSGTSGAVITVDLTAASTFSSGTITLKNIVIVAPDETASRPAAVELTIKEETAINGVMVDENASSDVYDLSGRRVRSKVSSLEGLAKGIYMINGKKVVKK